MNCITNGAQISVSLADLRKFERAPSSRFPICHVFIHILENAMPPYIIGKETVMDVKLNPLTSLHDITCFVTVNCLLTFNVATSKAYGDHFQGILFFSNN